MDNTQSGYPHPNQPPPPYQTMPQPGYPPPPTGQAYYASHSQTTVIQPGGGVTVVQPGSAIVTDVTGTTVIVARLGKEPSRTTCNTCKADIITRVELRTGAQTHLCAALLCLLTLWPCAWIPYCVDSCKKAEHYCPNCGVFLGSN